VDLANANIDVLRDDRVGGEARALAG